MGIPKLPTDNLYKFIALFGLIIFLSTFGCMIYIQHQQSVNAANLKLVENDLSSFKREHDLLKKEDDALLNKAKINTSPYEKKIIEHSWFELQKRVSFFLEKEQKFDSNYKNVEKDIIILHGDLPFFLELVRFCSMTGGILIAVGFLCWYCKLQRYKDKDVLNNSIMNRNGTKLSSIKLKIAQYDLKKTKEFSPNL